MKSIPLKEFGEILVSRDQAKKVFALAQEEKFKVIFDFTWINFLSSSFADELFAKWFAQYGKVFKIEHLNDNFFQNLIKQVIVWRKQLV